MVVHRDENWIPEFPGNARRTVAPASSAPAGRPSAGGSLFSASPNSSDDEGSSSPNITNRCSPKFVFSLISKFSEFKKQIVRDMGFGGILEMPCISKLNLKLSAWLLSKLDTEESCLILGEAWRIYAHEVDVGIVFGIPNGEIDISTTTVTDEQLDLLRSSIGLVGSDPRSIKGIEYVLEKHLDDQSSSQEIDSFKVAFVVFAIGHLLAPCVKHDQVHLDFWGALKNPSSLDRYNWCRYVYGHLLEAAQKVRAEIISKGRATSLAGCHYFLQILFLDNVDLGRLNKSHKVVPRVKVFDQESLKVMSLMCASRGEHDFAHFLGIRSAESSAYMRHTFQSPHTTAASPSPRVSSMVPILRRAPQSNRDEAAPLSAATYEFKSPTDLSSYIQKRHPGLEKTYFIDYIKNHNAFMMREIYNLRTSIMRCNAQLVDWLADHIGPVPLQLMHKKPAVQPYSNAGQVAKRYSPESEVTPAKKPKPSQVLSPASGPQATPEANMFAIRSLSSPIKPPSFDLGIETTPGCADDQTPKDKIIPNQHFSSQLQRAYTPASQTQPSCGVVSVSPIDATRHLAQCITLDIMHITEEGIDPTGKVLYGQWINQPIVKIVAPPSPVPRSSWSATHRHPLPDPVAAAALAECCKEVCETLAQCDWLIHPKPRYLLLTGAELINTFVEGKVADSDIIDAAFRRLNQLDVTAQTSGVPVRWRHFIESDFAMHSLAGQNPELMQSVYNQFAVAHYSLRSCTMILVPVLVDYVWCAFMFDMHASEVHILDPAHTMGRYHLNVDIYNLVDLSLRKCLDKYFEGSELLPKECWKLYYPRLSDSEFTPDDSGTVMIHYARHYNGVHLDFPIDKTNIDAIRHSVFWDLLTLQGNEAALPDFIIKCLN